MQKRILLAVSGMSPQIVTETLFSLATREKDKFIPTDIYLITTANGKKQAEQQLLHPETGKFHQFCKDYAMPDIAFPAENIQVIEDAEGLQLDDIKTPENNEAAADFITRKVRNLTVNYPESVLHVSIAGGRKTMGYYLGYALSLYGRKQDSMSHVLVTERYEGLKDFFYPTPYSQIIHDRDNRSLDTQEAEVMLAEIPFVRLIDGKVPLSLQQEKVGFSDSVRMAQILEEAPLLKINIKNKRFLVSELELQIPMTDANFGFYLWVLERSQEGRSIERGQLLEKNPTYAKEFLEVYENLNDKDSDRTRDGLAGGMTVEFLSDRLTATNKAFIDVLGKRAAQPYLIQAIGKKAGYKHYLITLSEDQIHYL